MFWACHVKNKVQYVIDNNKVYVGFSKVIMKKKSIFIVKDHYLDKKIGKGWQEWKESCIVTSLIVKMMKTRFTS
jgi:hypothetical protein